MPSSKIVSLNNVGASRYAIEERLQSKLRRQLYLKTRPILGIIWRLWLFLPEAVLRAVQFQVDVRVIHSGRQINFNLKILIDISAKGCEKLENKTFQAI